MNSVERVKAICKEQKIPISKLENDLGFSNGYIGQLRKGVFPADRLAKIADYFGVTTEYLLTGDETKKLPVNNEQFEESYEVGGAHLLFDASCKMPQEDREEILEILKMKQRKYGR